MYPYRSSANNYYAYLPPTSSRSSRNSSRQNMHYQYYQSRYRSQSTLFQNPYAHVNVSHVSTPRQHYQTPNFDDLPTPPASYRPSIYTPSHPPSRMSSEHDTRLATASALRERILTNIQQTIGEIDRELSSLPPPSATRRSIPTRIPPLDRQPSLLKREISHGSNQTWPNKPKRMYKVVPSLPSGIKQISRQTSTSQLNDDPPLIHSTPKPPADSFNSQSFIGQYHYGPEADEVEIVPRDPEDIEYSSVIAELNDFSFDAVTSTQEFLREPSMLSEHRAVIFVPQFVDQTHLGNDESTEDFVVQDFSNDVQNLREKLTSPLYDFSSPNAIDVRNYSLLIRTAPKPKTPPPTPPPPPPEPDLVNSILSKPVKHAHQSSNPSASVDIPPPKPPTPIPSPPPDRSLPTPAPIVEIDTPPAPLSSPPTDRSLPTPAPIPKSDTPPPPIPIVPIPISTTTTPRAAHFFSDFGMDGENDDEDEEELMNIDPADFTLPNESEKHSEDRRTSIGEESTKTTSNQSESKKSTANKKKDQEKKSTTPIKSSTSSTMKTKISKISTTTVSSIPSDNRALLNLNIQLDPIDSTYSHPVRISPEKNSTVDSPLPVALSSPDITEQTSPLSRPTTATIPPSAELERQTSPSPPIETHVLLTEALLSDPETTSFSIIETQPMTYFTGSQQRSYLSLKIQQPVVIEEKVADVPMRHVVFSDDLKQPSVPAPRSLSTQPTNSSWRQRIDKILTEKHSPKEKYYHVKSRVNSFANFDYRPRKILVVPPRKSRSLKKSHSQPDLLIPPMTKGSNFGRIWRSPSGTPRIFHQTLTWKSPSKIRAYSYENLQHKPKRREYPLLNRKVKAKSESHLNHLQTETIFVPILIEAEIPIIHSSNVETEQKIFDVQLKRSTIVDQKLNWTKKSKLKDLFWQNINYSSKKSKTSKSVPPSIKTLSLDTRAVIRYWSETDLHQWKNNQALLAESDIPDWNDVMEQPNRDHVKAHWESIVWAENPLKSTSEETPPRRPKWDTVSNTRSLNTVYNPTVNNSNQIRRGWDSEIRRRRVRKLPPLKFRKDNEEEEEDRGERSDQDKVPLAIEGPPGPSGTLAIDYHHDLSSRQRYQNNNLDIATYSSRRSSRALVPFKRQHDLQFISETPRSQRPIQQEWYDDANRGQLVPFNQSLISQRSYRTSIGSLQHTNTPRDQLTTRSVTRNSQHSSMSSRLLDTTIRTNRATELRLSRDMEEHHQHYHSPDQSMPFEIRGFQLEGTALNVPNDATIRPLSNVNYRGSERVKNHRIYPWSSLHGGTSSRNSTLVPIIELRHPSFDQSNSHRLVDMPALVLEE